AEGADQITEIRKTEDRSIWVGKVKSLDLTGYAVEILLKLRFHEENVMEEICLIAMYAGHTAKILGAEDNSIWMGKLKKMSLFWFAVEALPKLKTREKDVMGKIELYAENTDHVEHILGAEDRNISVGKVKELVLVGYAIEILPKLKLYTKREIRKLSLAAEEQDVMERVLRKKNLGILVGRVNKLCLKDFTVKLLPKLRIHEDDRMEKVLKVRDPEKIAGILGKRKTRSGRISKGTFLYYGRIFHEVFEFKFRSRVSRRIMGGGI
ncbi:MAG: uncharacterized protein A8A55_2638, partial [Amphiamblys sp. WSBS2006]